jgi:hypothetical protein
LKIFLYANIYSPPTGLETNAQIPSTSLLMRRYRFFNYKNEEQIAEKTGEGMRRHALIGYVGEMSNRMQV